MLYASRYLKVHALNVVRIGEVLHLEVMAPRLFPWQHYANKTFVFSVV